MPSRVLFLHCSGGGYGADRQLLHVVSGLDRDRFQPMVVLPPEPGPLARQLEEAGVPAQRHPLALLRRPLLRGRGVRGTAGRLRRDRSELGRIAREWGADIVHTNSSIVLSGQEVATRAGARHVMHVREIWGDGDGRVAAALWPAFRHRLLRADALLCVSAAAAEPLATNGRARVLHDGVATPALPPRARARAALGLPLDTFVVAVIGRVSDWKGQHVLAHALAQAPLARLGAIALVAGDPAPGQEHHQRSLAALRGRLGLGDRLRMLGFREDVEMLRAAADAEVVPSTRPDALPNSALEAAAAELPLVVTRGGGQTEIVSDGVTGRIVPPGDAGALATALSDLAEDPETARRLGRAAAADVRERFALERMLDQLHDCYERVIA